MKETLSASGRFCGDFAIGRIELPTVAAFNRDYASIGKPVIITNLLQKSKAARKWTPDYLIKTVGPQPITITRLRNHKLRSNNARYQTSFSEYATRAFANDPKAGEFCAQQIEVPKAIASDVLTPALVGSWHRVRPHLWLSTPGHVTETHRDANHNLLAQVIGKKKLTLYSPVFSHALYSHNARSPLARYSRVDMDRPDLYRFPAARELAGTQIILNAGETLFLPVYWWHRVETLEVSVSVNFWWAPPLNLSLHPDLPRTVTPASLFTAVHSLADLSSFRSEFDVADYLWAEGFELFAAAYLHHCIALLVVAKSRNPAQLPGQDHLARAAKGLVSAKALSEDDFRTIQRILWSCRKAVGLLTRRSPLAPRHGIADMRAIVEQARRLAAKLNCASYFRPARWVPAGHLKGRRS